MDPIIFIRIIGENPFSAYIPSPDGGIFLSDRILRSLRSFVIDSYEKLSTTPPFRTSASTLSLPTPHARIADNNEKSGSVALPAPAFRPQSHHSIGRTRISVNPATSRASRSRSVICSTSP